MTTENTTSKRIKNGTIVLDTESNIRGNFKRYIDDNTALVVRKDTEEEYQVAVVKLQTLKGRPRRF